MEAVAPSDRLAISPLIHQLFTRGDLFEFHAAMKLLGRIRYQQDALSPPLRLLDAKVVMRANPTLSSTWTDIAKILPPADDSSVPEMILNFFGLEVRQGPLPTPYVEQMMRAHRGHGGALSDFLSIFNTRLTHLFHESRKKYWIGLGSEAAETTVYGAILKSFLGLNDRSLENRLGVPDRTLLEYAGLLWQKPRSKEGAVRLLRHYLGATVRAEEFIGDWCPIPFSQRTSLGGQGSFRSLGQTAIVGGRFWKQSKYFRLIVGPLSWSLYVRCLKIGPIFSEIGSLMQFYLNKQQAFQILLLPKREEIPPVVLGKGSYLGWTTWLRPQALKTDPAPVVLTGTPFKPPV